MSSRPTAPSAAQANSERGCAITTVAMRSRRSSTEAVAAEPNASMADADSGGSTVRGGPDGCIEIDWSLTGAPYDLRSEQYGSRITAWRLETAESIGVAIAVGLLALMLVLAFLGKNVVAQ